VREKRLNEIKGFILIAAGLLILAGFISFTPFDLAFYTSHPNSPPHNWIRTFGAYGAGAFFFLFGWASYLVPACILFLGFRRFNQQAIDIRLPQIISLLVLLL
jgi:S-DNA-T family DNA segregation ATPase FtsK/SpoIIIE